MLKHLCYLVTLCTCTCILKAQPAWTWGNAYGGIKDENATCVRTDNSGNVYIAGSFNSASFTLGSTLSLKQNSKRDIFLAKINSTGSVVWAKTAGGHDPNSPNTPSTFCYSHYNYANSIAVDNSGNVYVAGMFMSDTFRFSASVQLTKACQAEAELFIAKYNSSGVAQWAKKFAGNSWEHIAGLSVDNTGNLLLAGTFWGTDVTFGSSTLNNSNGTSIFTVKMDNAGNVLWANGASGQRGNTVSAVTADASGNVIICGSFMSSTLTFGSQTLTNTGFSDAFIVKYDPSGNVLWATGPSGNNADMFADVVTDNSGNIYVAGRFASSQLQAGSLTLVNSMAGNLYEACLMKYDAGGVPLWADKFGGSREESALTLCLDSGGNILAGGLFNSPVSTFGSQNLTPSSSRNLFLARVDTSGNVLWAVSSATATGKDDRFKLAADASGNNYILGSLTGSFSIGSLSFTTTGLTDFYLIRFQ